MKTVAKSIIIILMISICQVACAQGMPNDTTTFYREKLLGKKWATTKNIQGKVISCSYVFDKDSITNTFIINNDTTVLRYAYYLANTPHDRFNSSFVGTRSEGSWLILCRLYTQNGMARTDRANMKIFSLTDNELSFGKSPNFPLVLTAMPLK